MKDARISYEVLARYLTGESSAKEKQELENRLENDPAFVDIYKKFKIVWNAKTVDKNRYNAEKAWEQLCRQIDNAEASKHEKKYSSHLGGFTRSIWEETGWLIRTAAVLLVVVLSSLFIFYTSDISFTEDPFTMREIVTEPGQRSNINLVEGSQIILNSQSKVTYLPDFEKGARVVHLEGEAYFRIADEERPFIVYVNNVEIKVIGTEFNVRSYMNEEITVAVANGEVSIQYNDYPQINSMLLSEGNMAILSADRRTKPELYRNVNLKHHIGWLEYNYVFEDTPLYEVAKVLDRSYGVEFEFNDDNIQNLRLSAEFEGDTIKEIIQVITQVLDLDVIYNGRKITFFKK